VEPNGFGGDRLDAVDERLKGPHDVVLKFSFSVRKKFRQKHTSCLNFFGGQIP
jgi:hypothetical protein